MPDTGSTNYILIICVVAILVVICVLLSISEAKAERRILKKYSASAQQDTFNVTIRALIGKGKDQKQAMAYNNTTDELEAHFQELATNCLVSEGMHGGMACRCICSTSTKSRTVDGDSEFDGELNIKIKIYSRDRIDGI